MITSFNGAFFTIIVDDEDEEIDCDGNTGCPESHLTKRKLNISVISHSNWIIFFLFERGMFKVLFDTEMSYMYCSKVSPFTSIQNFNLFTRP